MCVCVCVCVWGGGGGREGGILANDSKSWKFQINSPIRNLSLYSSNTDQVSNSTSDCGEIINVAEFPFTSNIYVPDSLQ